MVTYVFPGQGSQFVGMGDQLFDKYDEYVKQADEILGYSIKELCLEDPLQQLGNTKYTQVALYVVNALTYLEKVKNDSIIPDFVAGHSLGEYDALFAAGVFDFATGLKIVKKRAELMSEATGGGMAAVIGLTEDKIRTVLQESNFSNIDIANLNSYNQIVISGNIEDISAAQGVFEDAGAATYVKLKVSGAFHSHFMSEARNEFARFIEEFEFKTPQITVYSNVTAKPHTCEEIKERLIEQIVSSVRWCEIVTELMGYPNNQIIQVGPGKVLTGLTQKIKREIKKLGIQLEHIEFQESKDKQVNGCKESIISEKLGSEAFRKAYGLKYAYCAGGMYKGIASPKLVVQMAKAGMLAFLGTGGSPMNEVESWILDIKSQLTQQETFGVNVLGSSKSEAKVFNLIEKHDIHLIEAAAYINPSEEIVKYRVCGLEKENGSSEIKIKNKIMAKTSRPEVAEVFLSPAPERILNRLLKKGEITQEQYEYAKEIPMADDICVEGDSGGHTDRGNLFVILPAIQSLCTQMMQKYHYKTPVRVGAAGGIGAPGVIAAIFTMGADFIMTGSINQCSVEAGISDRVKDLLNDINVQDTTYCVSGDMFEWGSLVQVLKKGVFFPIRANKLYEAYQRYNSIDEIDEKLKTQIQEKYFKRTFEEVWDEICSHYDGEVIEKANHSPKYKMLLIFKWYYAYTTELALRGQEESVVNYQVNCGSALGAFNQYVKGTKFEKWINRHVDEIAIFLLNETTKYLNHA